MTIMNDIKHALYQRLLTDGALKTLLGTTESDPRIYSSQPPQQVPISGTQPAFVTMALVSLGEPTGPDGVTAPDEIYETRIWSEQPAVIETVASRIRSLLNGWTFGTTEHSGIWVEVVDSKDSLDTVSGRYCRKQAWRVWHIMDA